VLGKTSLHWSVELHEGGQVQPVTLGRSATGLTGAFKALQTTGASTSDFYHVTLTATDSKGASASVSADVHPQTAVVQLLATAPSLQVIADGVAYAAPASIEWVLGTNHTIEAAASQTVGGQDYVFARWSKGRAAVLNLVVKKPLTLTANYHPL
jgi:hypothetical protein